MVNPPTEIKVLLSISKGRNVFPDLDKECLNHNQSLLELGLAVYQGFYRMMTPFSPTNIVITFPTNMNLAKFTIVKIEHTLQIRYLRY